VKVATSPAFLEGVANHPRVRPYIGPGTDEFRAGDSWDRTVAFECESGGVVFIREAPCTYSVHLVFLPKTKDPAGKLREAMRRMFKTDCREVVGITPSKYRHVRKVAVAAGLKHIKDEAGFSHYALTAKQFTDEG
jgi:hypothetical protein